MLDATEIRNAVGANVKRLRIARGMSQNDLAAECGIHAVQVSRIENGHNSPSAELLYTLADVLGVPADALRQIAFHAA